MNSPPARTVFYPEMIAFGGAERILVALSRHLHKSAISHEIALYYLSVDLQSHAEWPLPTRQLRPPRNPLLKARSLNNYLLSRQAAGSGTALLVGIQAALHAGVLGSRDYILMILDTPSLLSPAQSSRTPSVGFSRSLRNLASHLILRRGMQRAKQVIATSRYMADEMKRLYGVESRIIRQGGHSPASKSGKKAHNGYRCFRMLSVSRLEPNKRIDWILKALSQADLAHQGNLTKVSWHLDIVGEGSQRQQLETQARLLGLEAQVTFHGYISDACLEELYSEASLFLMPAFQGYGLPALEALSRRVPVLLHRDSGVSEILQDTPWVELVDGDLDGLTRALGRTLRRLQSNHLSSQPLPAFPTESHWAEKICGTCGWR